MKKTLMITLITMVLYGCHGKMDEQHPNSNTINYTCIDSITNNINDNSTIINSLETDSSLYDPWLIMNPISDSVLHGFVDNCEDIDTIINELPKQLVIRYQIDSSFIVMHQDDEGNRTVIFFSINDKHFPLSNKITVGNSYKRVCQLYNKEIAHAKVISIVEESEMAEIKLAFATGVIEKIIYVDYESCSQWNIL